MVTHAHIGPGFLLDYENPDTPADWVHVGQVTTMDGPGEATDEFEVTNQDSEGAFREFVPTLQDGGNVTFDVIGNISDEGQTALAELKHDRAVLNWRILFPEDSDGIVGVVYFTGFLNNLGNTFPLDGAWTRSTSIRVTGPVTYDIYSS